MKMGIEWYFFPMVFNLTTLKNVTLLVQAGLFLVFPESTNADTDYRVFQHTHVTFCMRVPTGDSCTVTPTLRFSRVKLLRADSLENLRAGVTVTHPFGDDTLDHAEHCFSVEVLRLLCTTHCLCEHERVDTSFVSVSMNGLIRALHASRIRTFEAKSVEQKSFGWDYKPRSSVRVRMQRDHMRTLKIMLSMSEFGGLWKHQN